MDSILNNRFERAADALAENGIGAWIIIGTETHMLGEPAMLFLSPMHVLKKTAFILTADGRRICISHSIESEEFDRSRLFTEINVYRTFNEFEKKLGSAVSSLMPLGKIAIDFSRYDASCDGLSYSDYMLLDGILKKLDFCGMLVSSEPLIKKIRGKKSDEEVAKIKKAADCAMEIYEHARLCIKPGMSGKDVQDLFHKLTDEKKYGYSWQKEYDPYVSVGTRSSYNCKMPPDDIYITPGDLVNVDFGITVDGFSSDNQRSFYALEKGETEPPDEIQRAFCALQSVNKAVCAAMKTGVDSRSLADIGNKVMNEYGYEGKRFGGYGHEIGIFAHNGGIGAGESTAND
ncbi:MAG: M24 family metallopeptidase, partial [Eubacteriales bacterium]|nr:M24 family metallopeptidase [Eubacteriales bacterium]